MRLPAFAMSLYAASESKPPPLKASLRVTCFARFLAAMHGPPHRVAWRVGARSAKQSALATSAASKIRRRDCMGVQGGISTGTATNLKLDPWCGRRN